MLSTESFETAAQSESRALEDELKDFSYIVSHDLGACFRHVAEFSELLLSDLGDNITPSQRSLGAHMRRESERCQAMMDQLLVFSRTQGKVMALQRCDLTRVMETALLQLSAEVRLTNADISIEPLGEQICDPDLMIAAFKHALGNAIKFHRENVPPQIEVRGMETPDSWAVRIIDNGVGVALDRQEKMFRMFYQDQPEGQYPGVGAGLSICRRILRRHGGEARFIDSPGGACLELSLPPIDAAETAPNPRGSLQ